MKDLSRLGRWQVCSTLTYFTPVAPVEVSFSVCRRIDLEEGKGSLAGMFEGDSLINSLWGAKKDGHLATIDLHNYLIHREQSFRNAQFGYERISWVGTYRQIWRSTIVLSLVQKDITNG